MVGTDESTELLLKLKYLQQLSGNCKWWLGGSPVLLDMGGDWCSEVRGFESQYHILDVQFLHFYCKNEMLV